MTSYEIGNEPDITPTDPQDETSLHYANPSDYALVYETARSALHAVQPDAKAVVGGMLDSGAIPLSEAERYTAALTPGAVDAVGFHPYLYNETMMEQDTIAYRSWLDTHGFAGVPLDINEFGAFSGALTSASWGTMTADYTVWALCTAPLDVENVQAFWWGGTAGTDGGPWFPLVSSELTPTPYGAAYFNETHQLTTPGCPAATNTHANTHATKQGQDARQATHESQQQGDR